MIVHFHTTYDCHLDWKTGIEPDSEYWFDTDQVAITGTVFKFYPRFLHFTGGLETHLELDCSTFDISDSRCFICIDFADLEFLFIDGVQFASALPD